MKLSKFADFSVSQVRHIFGRRTPRKTVESFEVPFNLFDFDCLDVAVCVSGS